MRNKTYEVVVFRPILPTFRDTVCKDIVLLHPYIVFFDKDFVVKFFVGSFTVKTTRRFNNCYKSKRNFWGKCAAHQWTQMESTELIYHQFMIQTWQKSFPHRKPAFIITQTNAYDTLYSFGLVLSCGTCRQCTNCTIHFWVGCKLCHNKGYFSSIDWW